MRSQGAGCAPCQLRHGSSYCGYDPTLTKPHDRSWRVEEERTFLSHVGELTSGGIPVHV
jgi:hypothetical protein